MDGDLLRDVIGLMFNHLRRGFNGPEPTTSLGTILRCWQAWRPKKALNQELGALDVAEVQPNAKIAALEFWLLEIALVPLR